MVGIETYVEEVIKILKQIAYSRRRNSEFSFFVGKPVYCMIRVYTMVFF